MEAGLILALLIVGIIVVGSGVYCYFARKKQNENNIFLTGPQ